ncbi:MAG: hypothetical protein WC175_01825 [Candidatus Dojkabacteria bacterium]|jgi:hypothetical protein
MTETPINEETYTRKELPAKLQKIFTGRLSSAGQVVIPAQLRSGKLTSDLYPIPEGAKCELKLIAIHYPEK